MTKERSEVGGEEQRGDVVVGVVVGFLSKKETARETQVHSAVREAVVAMRFVGGGGTNALSGGVRAGPVMGVTSGYA